MPTLNQQLDDVLAQIRAGIVKQTVKEVASKTGLAMSTTYHAMQGRELRSDTLRKLCEHFDQTDPQPKTLRDMIEEIHNPKPSPEPGPKIPLAPWEEEYDR